VEGQQLPWLLNAMFTIAMAAARPPPIAMTLFHNTHATFPFIFKKEFPPPGPIHGGASHCCFIQLHFTSHVMKILKNQMKTHMGVVKVITWLLGEEQ
jgi:hypothetical protein